VTDDLLPYGLGRVESPPDERDRGVDALYAATGTEPPTELPTAHHVPAPLYPVVDQGSSPTCVAYSAAGYPLASHPELAPQHRIAAHYRAWRLHVARADVRSVVVGRD
jgi:hypothetical protein